MALKVIIPPGLTEVTVNGLHQWDYGREIEIHADNLPAIVEVHFACAGMETAVVRNCAVIGGAITAAVPDICLEQTTPIQAWVYAIGETTGETILTIKLPITSRTKPQPGATIPDDTSDKYTEAIAAMNDLYKQIGDEFENVLGQIDDELKNVQETLPDEVKNVVEEALENGEIIAKKAEEAESAGKATCDKNNNDISTTYVRKDERKVYSYPNAAAGSQSVSVQLSKNKSICIGTLPSDKTESDIVGVGIEVDVGTERIYKNLKLSAGKTSDRIADRTNGSPTNGGYIVPFSLTTSLISSGYEEDTGFGVACVDVYIGRSTAGELYATFVDGSCWFHNATSGECVSESLSGGNFILKKVYYWFA